MANPALGQVTTKIQGRLAISLGSVNLLTIRVSLKFGLSTRLKVITLGEKCSPYI